MGHQYFGGEGAMVLGEGERERGAYRGMYKGNTKAPVPAFVDFDGSTLCFLDLDVTFLRLRKFSAFMS